MSDPDRDRHIFGPVPSRRLGRSLGIDLVPHKVCTLDCLYCECGATTTRTGTRRPWVDTTRVLEELEAWLHTGQTADHLTFSGAGEPTLHSDLGRIASWLAERSEIPLALLTNATLLGDPGLRRELAPFSVIVPSLDACTQAVFERLNRPLPGLTVAGLIDGIVALREDYQGELWLEVLLVDGVNDSPEELAGLARAARRIAPDRIQLNTAVRPGTDPDVASASAATLQRALELFGPRAEAVAAFPERPVRCSDRVGADSADLAEAVLAVVRRRPETIAALSVSLGVARSTLERLVTELTAQGRLRAEDRGGHRYLIATVREA
ncbi:MAG: radical SAM protein [bacterium]